MNFKSLSTSPTGLTRPETFNKLVPKKILLPALAEPRRGSHNLEYREFYNEIAYNMSLLGLTLDEIATCFGVNVDAVMVWKRKYPKFAKSIRDGGQFADARVARAFFEKAVGYQHTVTKVAVALDGATTEYEVVEKFPPDTKALIVWLNNRQPRRWSDRVEITGKGGGPIDQVNTVITINDPSEAAKIYQQLISGE